MFSRVLIRGLGPHLDQTVDLDPTGITTISGQSEVGKTTVLAALCFALWGVGLDGRPLDAAAITAGADRAEVSLTTAKGAILRRSRTRKGAQTRLMIDAAGVETPYPTEDAWRAKLAKLGAPVCRHILVPLAWRELAESAGGGRALRDLLVGLLPPADLRAEVAALAGFALESRDPTSPKECEALRSEAKAERDRREGAAQAIAAGNQEAEVAPRPESDVEPSRAILAAAEAWRAFDAAVRSHREALAKRAADLAEHERRTAALPPQPTTPDPAIVDAVRRAAQETETSHRAALARWNEATAAEATWRTARAAWERTARSEAAARVSALRPDRVEVRPRVDEDGAWSELVGLRGDAVIRWFGSDSNEPEDQTFGRAWAWVPDAINEALGVVPPIDESTAPPRPAVDVAALAAASGRALEARDRAADRLRVVESQLAAVRSWEQARDRLGVPPAPVAVPPAPVEPSVVRPVDAEVKQARDAIKAWEQHNTRARVLAGERDQRVARMQSARAALDAATARVARAEALLDAARKAPSAIARRQADAIGDLGPVSLVWSDGGGVEVLVDGRPWWCASTGRQIVADVAFRAALRRLAGAGWLPMFVDRVQDVAGQDLGVVGPAILLRTADGPLRVTS